MISKFEHIGLTVSNLENSIEFYRDVLGLKLESRLVMNGDATDKLFSAKNVKLQIAYFRCDKSLRAPLIELIEFDKGNFERDSPNLFKTSISEICFCVDDIYKEYSNLLNKGVEFLSEPQYFDFRNQGFGECKVVYFKDIDGIHLELLQNI